MDVSTTASVIVQIGTAINAVIFAAFGVSLAVVLAKAFGGRELAYKGAKISVDRTWILIALLTIAHAFLAWVLLRSVGSFLNCASASQAAETWTDLTERDAVSDRLVFLQMVERARLEGWGILGSLLFISVVSVRDLFDDPALVVQVAAAVLMCVATLRFRSASLWLRVETTLATITLVVANIVIVSAWALAVSDISRSSATTTVTSISSDVYEWFHPRGMPQCNG